MSNTEQNVNVYVWDMDETLVLLKSLLEGSFAKVYNGSKDLKRGMEIGKQWENSILQLCDDLFHYNHVSLCELIQIMRRISLFINDFFTSA